MVGMGSVVTLGVPDFHLVVGNPARSIGYVCRCGKPLARFSGPPPAMAPTECKHCGAAYSADEIGKVSELAPPKPRPHR
jgi:hypothetical protein